MSKYKVSRAPYARGQSAHGWIEPNCPILCGGRNVRKAQPLVAAVNDFTVSCYRPC